MPSAPACAARRADPVSRVDPAAPPAEPRQPVRANGRRRYEQLLDAAERLLEAANPQPITIQNIAREAGVPMASVYHFLPGPAAVWVALSRRYMADFGTVLADAVPGIEAMAWRQIIATLIGRGVAYYRSHPYAQKLILGADLNWSIRREDIANNRRIAAVVAGLLARHFPAVDRPSLVEAVVAGITIGDALFALSIAEHGQITPACGDEATLAICGYLDAKFTPGNARLD